MKIAKFRRFLNVFILSMLLSSCAVFNIDPYIKDEMSLMNAESAKGFLEKPLTPDSGYLGLCATNFKDVEPLLKKVIRLGLKPEFAESVLGWSDDEFVSKPTFSEVSKGNIILTELITKPTVSNINVENGKPYDLKYEIELGSLKKVIINNISPPSLCYGYNDGGLVGILIFDQPDKDVEILVNFRIEDLNSFLAALKFYSPKAEFIVAAERWLVEE